MFQNWGIGELGNWGIKTSLVRRESAPAGSQNALILYFPNSPIPQFPNYSRLSYSSLRRATTFGSARVVVSPSALPSAMSRRSRRMILPDLVLGRSAENRI